MRCAVLQCDNNDSQKMHRFPENKPEAQKWKESLQLKEFPIELLQSKFGVCSLHFSDDDFESFDPNKCVEHKRVLKQNAIPSLRTKEINQSVLNEESIGCIRMSPINETFHQEPTTSRPRIMEFSTASTGGNDISILKTHDSHYGDSSTDDDSELEYTERRCKRKHSTIDAPDFEVLHEQHYLQNFVPSSRNAYSGTDSDIEVLMSEEIQDTEWSAALENIENSAIEQINAGMVGILVESEDNAIVSTSHQESTDRDCSVEELSCQSSLDCLDGLHTDQLIQTIREQRVRIQELEASINRFRVAQESFFEYVENMRQEYAAVIDVAKTRSLLD